MKNNKHTHKNSHNHDHKHDNSHKCHDHGHNHSHGNMPVVLFSIGLAAYIIASFLTTSLFTNILFIGSMITSGYHIIYEGFVDTYKATRKNKRFSPNIHILMTLAAIGAAIIGNFAEGALLIVIFAGAHFLEHFAEDRSKREITNLLKMNPTEARLLQADGTTQTVDVASLKIGDKLRVLNGDQVPTDGIILEGYSAIDESSINGESIPAEKSAGDKVFGSTINGTGSFTMEVTKDSKDTLFAKIIQLVNASQSNISKTATTIRKIEPYYVTAVLIIVPIFIILGPTVFGWDWFTSFYRGMVFLTVASPCALAASAIPATLAGISNLAKQGVLFKGGVYLSNLNDVKAVAFDKTGTLTQGKPVVTDVYFDDDADLAYYANIIVGMEKTANHPLAEAIIDKFTITEKLTLDVENKIGFGLYAYHNNKAYRIGKPDAFENVPEVVKQHNDTYANEGKTVVYFSEDDVVKGMIAMMDVPNSYAKKVVSYLAAQGIHTIMITGDAERTGQAVGQQIGIERVIGNVLPENKAKIIADLQQEYGVVAMLGDGVNDAPALVGADIGIAMGDGTDIAIDVADAVLMRNDLTKLSYAHQVSRKLSKVVWQNIIFSMFVVVTLIFLNITGNMDLPIGVMVHEGSTLVVLFNGLRLLLPMKS